MKLAYEYEDARGDLQCASLLRGLLHLAWIVVMLAATELIPEFRDFQWLRVLVLLCVVLAVFMAYKQLLPWWLGFRDERAERVASVLSSDPEHVASGRVSAMADEAIRRAKAEPPQ